MLPLAILGPTPLIIILCEKLNVRFTPTRHMDYSAMYKGSPFEEDGWNTLWSASNRTNLRRGFDDMEMCYLDVEHVLAYLEGTE